MSPVVVRTFSIGPPPFKLPSAVAVPGPHSPPSVVTRISEKSERMRWPLASSMEARIVMFRFGRQIDRDVAGGSFQHRIGALAAGDELGDDSAGPGLGPGRRHAVERNAAARRSRPAPLRSPSSDGCCRRRFQSRPGPAISPNSMLPPPVVTFNGPAATLHFDAAAAGFEHRALQTGDHHHAAAAGLGIDLSLGRRHLDAAATGAQRKIAADRAHVDAAAAGLGVDHASDVVQVNAAAAALTLRPGRRCPWRSDRRRRSRLLPDQYCAER